MTTGTLPIDLAAVEQLIADGFISRQKHPSAELFIYNYTPKAQFERCWTPETLACRGLILDAAGNVRARPFPKFFNLEEHDGEVPVEPFEVFDKLDGSLGISYRDGAEVRIATRGSFTSEQALRAQAIYDRKYGRLRLDPSRTYLFEIIYPENRIVIDYGGMEDLVLLAVIDTETGVELPPPDIGFPVVRRYDGITDIAALKALEESNREGFVVRFTQSNLRLKVKFAEYVRLHRLITGVNERHIWELLRDGVAVDPLFERVPDEFNQWLRATIGGLEEQYGAVEALCRSQFRDLGDRKATALYFAGECDHPAVLFRMLDGKSYNDVIWKMLKPEASRPFRQDEE
ncbi:MAG: RNA ligase [Tepidiformaceae bacterium]